MIEAQCYEDALSLLEGFYYTGVKLGLENTLRMLELVDSPHDKLKFIHVAGTNGKGSVCAMLASALYRSGYRTGLFTSPHLVSIRERFRINGKPIDETEFAKLVFSLYDRTKILFDDPERQQPTFFEFITVLAFLYFRKNCVDVVVVEVGLGGRLDSTNVISPSLSVITTIDIEHTLSLGTSLEEIAVEKGGIIKNGIPVICGDGKVEVQRVITEVATRKNARLYLMNTDFDSVSYRIKRTRSSFLQENIVSWCGDEVEIVSSLIGRHQCDNVSIVYAALIVLDQVEAISHGAGRCIRDKMYRSNTLLPKAIDGIKETDWPGRLQILKNGLLLDSAHNLGAMKESIYSIKELFPDRKWNVLFAVLSDKKWQEMLSLIIPMCKKVFLVDINNRRAESAENISAYIQDSWNTMPVEICLDINHATSTLETNGDGLVLGSSYLVGDVLKVYVTNEVV